jgi:U3 small nucleolar RNA-associated protein 9
MLICPLTDDDNESGEAVSKRAVSDPSLAKRFELEDDVLTYQWIYVSKATNGTVRPKRRTRRRDNDEQEEQEKIESNGNGNGNTNGHAAHAHNEENYLFVALANGTSYIFSPFKDEQLLEFTTDYKITDVVAMKDGKFWISGSGKAELYSINDNNAIKTVEFPQGVRAHAINVVVLNRVEVLVVGAKDKLILIDIKKDHVIAELTDDEFSKNEVIGDILGFNGELIVSSKNLNKLRIFDLKKKKLVKSIKSVTNISTLFKVNDVSIGIVSINGQIEIISNISTKHKINVSSSVIKTNDHKTKLSDAVIINNGDTLLVTYFELEPLFKSYQLDSLPESTTIEIKQKESSKSSIQIKLEIQLPSFEEIEYVSEYDLRDSELVELIESKSTSPLDLLKVLNSNSTEDKIKFVVSKISKITETGNSNNNSLIARIFYTLTERVELVITYPVLNTWLKWLLIFHSALITKLPGSNNALKQLRVIITRHLKQLPGLLSLQGRLELLKSQLQLRTLLANVEVNDDDDDDDYKREKTANDVLVSKAEESITYVNGENDEEEVDDVIGSVGNSESDVSDDEDDEKK